MAQGPIVGWWQHLRAWNQRFEAWLDSPPWRNGVFLAMVVAGTLTVSRLVRRGDPDWALTAFEFVLFFGIGCAAAVRRRQAREDSYRPPRPLPDVPGHADDDGRRWRVGSP